MKYQQLLLLFQTFNVVVGIRTRLTLLSSECAMNRSLLMPYSRVCLHINTASQINRNHLNMHENGLQWTVPRIASTHLNIQSNFHLLFFLLLEYSVIQCVIAEHLCIARSPVFLKSFFCIDSPTVCLYCVCVNNQLPIINNRQ